MTSGRSISVQHTVKDEAILYQSTIVTQLNENSLLLYALNERNNKVSYFTDNDRACPAIDYYCLQFFISIIIIIIIIIIIFAHQDEACRR